MYKLDKNNSDLIQELESDKLKVQVFYDKKSGQLTLSGMNKSKKSDKDWLLKSISELFDTRGCKSPNRSTFFETKLGRFSKLRPSTSLNDASF